MSPVALRRVPVLLVLALWVSVGGAIGCSRFRAPTISVGPAAFVDETDEAIEFDIELDLTNPNDEPIELREFQYTFSVQGRQVFTGRRSAQATLSARGGKRMRLPVVVRLDRAGWPPRPEAPRWSVSGRLLYITPGEFAEVLLDTGVRRPKVGFSGRGRLMLDAGPAPD